MSNIKVRLYLFFCFFILNALLFSIFCSAEETKNQLQDNSPIKIGMSTALSGTAKALGQNIKLGVDTYFAKVNEAGGIDGRKLELIALDDQYNPELTGPNMHQLIDNHKVLAIIGNVGTPTALVSIPIVNESKILLFGAFAGSNALRKTPPDRYIINFRASYDEETDNMIKGLLSIGIKPEDIAFFIQNDSAGDSGHQGALQALKKVGFSDPEKLPIGRFERNTVNIEEGFSELLSTGKTPKAIIMMGTYSPIVKFIKLAKDEFKNTLFLNVSFVGTNVLEKELGTEAKNVIITQVVPSPDSDLPAIQEYREDFKKHGHSKSINYGTLEGYLDAKLFVLALKSAASENKLNREGVIDAFEKMRKVDIGIGILISFDKDHHQALHTVWPTIMVNGKFLPFNWKDYKPQL